MYVGPVSSPGASKCVDINLEISLSQSKYFTAWISPHPLGQAPSGHTGPSYGCPCSSHPAQLRFDRLSRVPKSAGGANLHRIRRVGLVRTGLLQKRLALTSDAPYLESISVHLYVSQI